MKNFVIFRFLLQTISIYYTTSKTRMCPYNFLKLDDDECIPCPQKSFCKYNHIYECTPGYYLSPDLKKCIICPDRDYKKPCTNCVEPNNCPEVKLNQIEPNITEILYLAEHSHHNIYHKDTLFFEDSDFKLIENKNKSLRAVIMFCKHLQNLVIIFRGTQTFENYKTDAKFILKDMGTICKGCKIHSGFISAYEEISNQVLEKYESLRKRYKGYKTILTGHSMGGALATIASVYLKKEGLDFDLYTFGSPRVGNQEFAEFVNNILKGNNFRVTFKEDPVAVVPPRFIGYHHAGTEIHFYDHMEYHVFYKNWDRSASMKLPYQKIAKYLLNFSIENLKKINNLPLKEYNPIPNLTKYRITDHMEYVNLKTNKYAKHRRMIIKKFSS
jgi:hypothetical protein